MTQFLGENCFKSDELKRTFTLSSYFFLSFLPRVIDISQWDKSFQKELSNIF